MGTLMQQQNRGTTKHRNARRPVAGQSVRRAPVCAPSYHPSDSRTWSFPLASDWLNDYPQPTFFLTFVLNCLIVSSVCWKVWLESNHNHHIEKSSL